MIPCCKMLSQLLWDEMGMNFLCQNDNFAHFVAGFWTLPYSRAGSVCRAAVGLLPCISISSSVEMTESHLLTCLPTTCFCHHSGSNNERVKRINVQLTAALSAGAAPPESLHFLLQTWCWRPAQLLCSAGLSQDKTWFLFPASLTLVSVKWSLEGFYWLHIIV